MTEKSKRMINKELIAIDEDEKSSSQSSDELLLDNTNIKSQVESYGIN